MKLAKFVLEIRFKDSGRPFNWRESLMQAIAGQAQLQQPQNRINEVIELNLTDHKAKILIENTRIAMGIESCADIEELKKVVAKLIERIANNTGWNKTLRVGVRSIWYEEVQSSFENLVSDIKTKNFISNTITDSATDIALSFTLTNETDRINYNAGAMKKEELGQRYGINTESIPDVILVADVDYVSISEMQFNKNNVKNFIEKALTYSSSKADETSQINL